MFFLKIYPPREPLEFPLEPALVCNILGIHKSTFFRWEKAGLIPAVPQSYKGITLQRQYHEKDFRDLLIALQDLSKQQHYEDKLKWIADINLEEEGIKIDTPNNFTIYL